MRSSAPEPTRDFRQPASKKSRTDGPRIADPHRPMQLELFGLRPVHTLSAPEFQPADPSSLRFHLLRRLNRLTGGRVRSLELTDNSRTILSVRSGRMGNRAPLVLRIHHSFTHATEDVLRAVADFVGSKRGTDRAREALFVIREHFTAHRTTARSRRLVLRPEGKVLDLREVFADLNERYFEGRLAVDISWGREIPGTSRCRRPPGTSILQLGSYSYEDRLIRVHRLLDDPEVPRYVVESVVHHEMLHADMPPEVQNGRRLFHTPEFRRRERLYRNLWRAERWIASNISALLRARRAAKPSRKR
jgi:hypothetical protein